MELGRVYLLHVVYSFYQCLLKQKKNTSVIVCNFDLNLLPKFFICQCTSIMYRM